MFKKYKLNRAISSMVEDKLYEMALDEVENGILKKGAWARALSQSDGIDAKAKSIYLQFRVEAMKNEAQIMESVLEELNKVEKREIIEDKKTLSSNTLSGSRENIVSAGKVKNNDRKLETKKTIDDDASKDIANLFLAIYIGIFIVLFFLIANNV
jgi:hypothetical protein